MDCRSLLGSWSRGIDFPEGDDVCGTVDNHIDVTDTATDKAGIRAPLTLPPNRTRISAGKTRHRCGFVAGDLGQPAEVVHQLRIVHTALMADESLAIAAEVRHSMQFTGAADRGGEDLAGRNDAEELNTPRSRLTGKTNQRLIACFPFDY